MFPLDPNKDWDVCAKICRRSLSLPGAKYPAFHPGTSCDFQVGSLQTNRADYLGTLILTAEKTGFVPALPLALHFLGEVDGFLAAAALVSSPKRHPVSLQESLLTAFVIHCIYYASLLEYRSVLLSRRRPSATLKATCNTKATCNNTYKRRGAGVHTLLFLSLILFQQTEGLFIPDCKMQSIPAGFAQIAPICISATPMSAQSKRKKEKTCLFMAMTARNEGGQSTRSLWMNRKFPAFYLVVKHV